MRNNNPLVSVIIPVYNRVKYIYDCLESVLTQSYRKLEIIVIDDGSTDGTGSEIKKIQDKRIQYIYQENSGHPGMARNSGLKKAHGDYIAFLDSDDIWQPEKIEKQIALISDEQPVISTRSYYILDGNHTKDSVFHDSYGGIKKVSLKSLILFNEVVTSSVLMDRSIIDTIGFFQ